MELGKTQILVIMKKVDFGVYLAEAEHPDEKVLLPGRQVPEGAQTGSIGWKYFSTRIRRTV